MRSYRRILNLCVSTVALSAGASLCGTAAFAQAPGSAIETVVVTGSSIRGTAPVGSNLSTVSPEDIEKTGAQTLGEVMASLPNLENFGSSGRNTATSGNGNVGQYIGVHQLGANGSASTLVIVDGHRVPGSGTTNYFVDANNFPANMIDRVELLADGSSSVYGSDAVAGVVNFITRKRFDGVQAAIQSNFTDGSNSYKGSLLVGKSWDEGGFMASVSYDHEGQLLNTSRPWTDPLTKPAAAAAHGLTGTGTTNFGSFNCDPASVQPNGAGNIFITPTSTTSVANAAANQTCSAWAYSAFLPLEKRINSMIKVYENITSRLSLVADMVYGTRNDSQATSRGTLTAFAYGSGIQANPYYINPPGQTATRQQVRYDFDALLGPGAAQIGSDDYFEGHVDLTYNIDDNWSAEFLAMGGRDRDYNYTVGTISSAVATLALNGTTQSTGITTNINIPGYTAVTFTQAGAATNNTSIPGYNGVILNLPLTTSNALDVWNPAASNKTSQAVRTSLLQNQGITNQIGALEQFQFSVQGTLFKLPAGDLKLAVGAELLDNNILKQGASSSATAGINSAGLVTTTQWERRDYAEYAEANIPVVSPEMNWPFVHKLDIDISARHDSYSDFGATTNPKIAFTWELFEGLRTRGNISTSFVAPPLTQLYDQFGGASSRAQNASINSGSAPGTIPVSLYPAITQFGIAGCTAASATCSTSSLQGLTIGSGDAHDTAATGRSWSVGIDYNPSYLEGLSTAVTLWHVSYLHGTTAPQSAIIVFTATTANQLTLYPACATTDQIAAIQGGAKVGSAFPACVQFVYQNITSNYLNFYTNGLDTSIGYKYDSSIGTFSIDENMANNLFFHEGFARHGALVKSQIFSGENLAGVNATFSILSTQSRTHLGWALQGMTADLFTNWTGGYKNGASPVNPLVTVNGLYAGTGGDHVGANVTFDLHLAYNFDGGMFGGDQISLGIQNLTDKRPPYYNSSSGYDTLEGNPIGRNFTVGFQAKF